MGVKTTGVFVDQLVNASETTIVHYHQVTNNDGTLGGYGGGLHRKEWLIKHENEHA